MKPRTAAGQALFRFADNGSADFDQLARAFVKRTTLEVEKEAAQLSVPCPACGHEIGMHIDFQNQPMSCEEQSQFVALECGCRHLMARSSR